MEPEQSAQLEHILGHMAVGVAILNRSDLRIRYINPFLLSLLAEPWRSQGVVGHLLEEVVSGEGRIAALPLLQQVRSTGQGISISDIPYEGFLMVRGRTYWRVSIDPSPTQAPDAQEQQHAEIQNSGDALLITIEDVTNPVRSRLYLKAIHHISSAIAGPYALPQVLDRILQAVQEMVGSTRCAVLLIDQSVSGFDLRISDFEELLPAEMSNSPDAPPTVTIAAQKGMHLSSYNWRPQISEQLLLGHILRDRRTLVITDTSTVPELEFPLLDDEGTPRRPASVLCVPIFEPTADDSIGGSAFDGRNIAAHPGAVLGTIEVYHRRVRGFPTEEVELLEQFAQQAGLAIQNARLFLRINRLARDASRDARQRENIMQAIPDGVIIYDPRWRVADANHAVRKLLGWTEDVIGLHVSEAMARSTAIFPPEATSITDLVAELERRALERRVDEFKIIGADGQDYTMRCSYAPIHDEPGNIFAFVVIYHDVTEQALARERIETEVIARTAELAQRNLALRVAKAEQELESARMQLLLESLPVGVMLVSSEDNSITVINRQAVQIMQHLGLPLEPLDDLDQATKRAVGRNVEELLCSVVVYAPSGSPVPYEERPLALALLKGEASEAEVHTTQPDGQTIFLRSNAAPLRASDETITGAVFVWHDTTKSKALERAREDFFTTMAHELKTPLANIRAHLSALQAKDLQWSAEKQQDFLETADEQVERLVGMINHFLDASRVEAGALRLELEPILLPEMFEDLQDRLEALISSSQRRLEINAPLHLPAVLADYELIMSVLTNLLSNAFRYAPEGDTVRLEAEPVFGINGQQPSGVELRVIDRGSGMTSEQQAELFTRFSTFAATRRPAADRPGQPAAERRKGTMRWSPATGLGLYISRGIVEAHGSTLTLKSSPGEGATFAFTLPVFVGKESRESPVH